jgi:hypothetical protein
LQKDFHVDKFPKFIFKFIHSEMNEWIDFSKRVLAGLAWRDWSWLPSVITGLDTETGAL